MVSQKTFQFVCQSVAPVVSQRGQTSSTLVLYMRFCAKQQPNLLEALCYQKFLKQISQTEQTDLQMSILLQQLYQLKSQPVAEVFGSDEDYLNHQMKCLC